jgi:AraC family transcriptional regulator of arabinose operon
MKHFNEPHEYGDPVPGIIVAGHFFVQDTYITKRPQGIKDCLITFTLQGEGYFIAGDNKQICKPGDVVILKGRAPHQYGTSPGHVWNFVWSHFSHDLLETPYFPDEELIIQSIDNDYMRKRIYRAFKRVIQDSRERRDYWHELCKNSLKEILLLLAQRQTKKLDPRIEQALHLLSSHMKEPLRIEEIAKSIGLSASRFSHLFKENVGHSVIETLNQMRLNQAALLLEHTARNAMEVAFDVGFHNYNHFAKLFRKHFGTNPRSYKKSKT